MARRLTKIGDGKTITLTTRAFRGALAELGIAEETFCETYSRQPLETKVSALAAENEELRRQLAELTRSGQ